MSFTATRSGTLVDLLRPEPALIFAADIAEALAKVNRWAGATSSPLAVAQHSLCVAREMEAADGPLAALYGLLHDAHEFVIGDVLESTRLALNKIIGSQFSDALDDLRERVDLAIHRAFDLDWPRPEPVERLLVIAHARVVATEIRDFLPGKLKRSQFVTDAAANAAPLKYKLAPVDWIRADAEFKDALARYVTACGIKQTQAFAERMP